jgi:hypothetical protein
MADTIVEDEDFPEEPKGALETSLWCAGCFLPGGIRWPVVTTDHRAGVSRVVGSAVVCVDCGYILDDEGNRIRLA